MRAGESDETACAPRRTSLAPTLTERSCPATIRSLNAGIEVRQSRQTASGMPGPADGPVSQPYLVSRPLWIALIGLLAFGAIAAVWWNRSGAPSPEEQPLLQLDVELRSEGVLGSEVGPDMALSPDGTRLVFITRGPDGLTHLNARRLDQPVSAR